MLENFILNLRESLKAFDQRIYTTEVSLAIRPIWFDRPPTVKISIGDYHDDLVLEQPMTINTKVWGTKDTWHKIEISHYGKTDQDCRPDSGLDTAVIIEKISFNGISSPRFVWQGVYRPHYPEHYQDGLPELKNSTYLGWNGVWTLEFSAPVFTWIHRIENLGWIYD
jgi:hypothetical protein